MKKYLVLFWLLFGVLPFSQAQQHQYSWKIGVHGGFATYYGDLSHQVFDVHHKMKAPFQNLDFWAYGLSLEYHVSKTFGIRLMGFKSQIVSNDRTYSDNGNFNRALNVQTDLIDVSLLGVIYLDNGRIFGHKAVVSPYFLIGGGLTYFDAKADLLAADGNRYYYWSDKTIRNLDEADPNANLAVVIDLDNKYETALSPLQTEGYKYLPITWHVAAGLGFKFRLSKRFHLHLEAVLRYTGTDYLDDVSGDYLPYYTDNVQAYAANPSNDNRVARGSTPDMNDWTSYIALSLHYSFGQKTYDMRPSIIYTPSILLGDAVSADSVSVVNKNEIKKDTSMSNVAVNSTTVPSDTTQQNKTIGYTNVDTIHLKDSLSVVTLNSKQKNDTIAGQKVDSIKIIENGNYNKNISNEVHELQIGTLEMEYEYQLKLLKQEYEYELKIQALGHQLELEKLKKSQPQESYEKDLQKLKYEQDLKLQKQDFEHQLKVKELQHALELEQIQNKKTSFRDTSANTVTHWLTTEEHHTHYDNNNNGTKNNSTTNNANMLPLQQRLDKLLLEMEQQQKQLDALLNLERNTVSKNENNSSNTSNTTTASNTSTNTKELEEAKAQNNLLQAQIEVLEQALKQNISKDSTNSSVSNSGKEKDLQNQLYQQTALNKDLTDKLAKANLQNNQQKERIDSLLIKVNELESAKKNISNELGKFLNKESSTHITKIYFAVNKTNLTIQAEETLTTLAQHLKNYPDVRYWVKGFASRKGDAVRNEQLSKERAEVVAAYLEQLGVQKDRLKMTSLGSSQSILDNDVDRRAEVHLYFE